MKKISLILSFLFFLSLSSYAQKEKEPVLLKLTTENTLFSPVAKVQKGVSFKAKIGNAKKVKLCFLTIRSGENNKKVKEIIIKKSQLPEVLYWDGTDKAGEMVPDGQYYYKFFIKTDAGSAVVENSDITIDSTPPFVSLKCAQDVYFIKDEDKKISKDIIIYLSSGDENGIDFSKSYLEILSYNNLRIKEFKFKERIPEFITWDGIDEIYGLPMPLGNYKVNFVVTDKAGNNSSIDAEISIAPMPKEPEQPKEVEVKQEERGLVINLSSKVLFDVNKSEIKPEAEKSLSEVAAILRVYPKNKVLIEGHTDSSGIAEKNQVLSVDRAQAVFDFLVSRGIDKDRMQVFGFGDTKPVALNDTPQGKEQNRRVEVVILKAEPEISKTEKDLSLSMEEAIDSDESVENK